MNVLNVFYGTAALGFGALVPLYAENRYHIHIANAGTLLSARAIGMICIAAAAAMMLRRTGYRLPMIVGFTAIAVGLVMLFDPAPARLPAVLVARRLVDADRARHGRRRAGDEQRDAAARP